MATRVQSLKFGLGLAAQADINTASASFLTFRKLNMDIHTNKYGTETDKDEIGKGTEFITQVFPTAFDFAGRIEKYGSAEFTIWAWAYALSNVTEASGLYTIIPQDPGVTLENKYFSLVQQLPEGGSMAEDKLYYGCSLADVTTDFNYGPGRQSVRTVANFAGSGKVTIPSGVSLPTVLTEHYMLSQSMTATINGTNYTSTGARSLVKGSISWNNSLLLPQGFYPGSGTQTVLGGAAAAVRGRQEFGSRVPAFSFEARLTKDSDEYSKLVNQNTATGVLTFTFDATHTVTFTFESLSYTATEIGEDAGIATVRVETAPKQDPTNGVLTVTGKCGVTGIAQ